ANRSGSPAYPGRSRRTSEQTPDREIASLMTRQAAKRLPQSQSISTEFSKQPRDLAQLQELARRYNANRLVRLPIEVPRSCIDRDDVVRSRSQSAFEKPVVRLVSNHAQFRQRVARKKTPDNFGDQLRVFADNV